MSTQAWDMAPHGRSVIEARKTSATACKHEPDGQRGILRELQITLPRWRVGLVFLNLQN